MSIRCLSISQPRALAVSTLLACITAPLLVAEVIGPLEPYAAVAESVSQLVRHEARDKQLPAVSVALVEGGRIVWARGFGHAELKTSRPASAATVYRVGSVSKLLTDIAVMQLVEQGKVKLDAPVSQYLPEFRPQNPFDEPITLRQLMAHRSGLVREPPVGNYFDPTEPSLADTVSSLNRTTLVYRPTSRTKYSNAGIAVVGLVLERIQGKPFVKAVLQSVLIPARMTSAGFAMTPDIDRRLAKAVMWSYDGREFPAPNFALGTSPAGNLYASVTDLANLITILCNDGRTQPSGQLLKPETLHDMWKPQFEASVSAGGFGLGFSLSMLDGHRVVGHGGAVYGFSTQLSVLPDNKLGVAVASSRDVTNSVVERIASYALRCMLAAREGKAMPAVTLPTRLDAPLSRRLAGRYATDESSIELVERDGKVKMYRGAYRTELKSLGDKLVVDDALAFGTQVERVGDDTLRIDETSYHRVPLKRPLSAPEKWKGLIGEYGWDHNTLFILEREGRLWALIEWVFLYPLAELGPDAFAFPATGLYHGEKLIFRRNNRGQAESVEAASVVFQRRPVGVESGRTFRIEPIRPVDALLQSAIAAKPPAEPGEFFASQLVEVTQLEASIKLDVRYATTNNFMSNKFYSQPRVFLQRPAAEAVVRAHRRLASHGFGLLIYDGYRPWYVTKMFWDATPEHLRQFVANPETGSRHNRGCAVDIGLFELGTGRPAEMVTDHDEFSARAYADYQGGTSLERWHRELLREALRDEGFAVLSNEWWHFDYKDWAKYPIGNLRFEEIASAQRK